METLLDKSFMCLVVPFSKLNGYLAPIDSVFGSNVEYHIYKDSLSGPNAYCSRVPLDPVLIEYMSLRLHSVEQLVRNVKGVNLDFYSGPLSNFPIVARRSKKGFPRFKLNSTFNIVPTFKDDLFIWSRNTLTYKHIYTEDEFTCGRTFNRFRKMSQHLDLTQHYEVFVEEKAPALRLVSDNVNS